MVLAEPAGRVSLPLRCLNETRSLLSEITVSPLSGMALSCLDAILFEYSRPNQEDNGRAPT